MKKLPVNDYITSRQAELQEYKDAFQRMFYYLTEEELLAIPEGEQWSAVECIEHLNFFSELYLPQLTAICKREEASEQSEVKLNWLAGWARRTMEKDPKEKKNKMKTGRQQQPRRLQAENLKMNPQKALENFLSDLEQLSTVINIIPHSSTLSKAKVQSAIPGLKLRALTSFELLLPHIGRHLKQAERILQGGKN
jgi:hypothetical protein